jgi:thioredoxin reductase
VRDRPLAVLAKSEHLTTQAALIRNWSRDLVALTDGADGLDGDARSRLAALDVPVKEDRVSHLEGDADAGLRRIVFEDGSGIEREGLFYAPPQRQRSDLAESLGCEMEEMGLLTNLVKADQMTRETTVPGVYVAGDAGTMLQGAIMAAASGASAAAFINHSLIAEEAELAASAHRGGGISGHAASH